uniref:taste receptor type 2 member 7-like n=1 Tax=Euleptes europaea TaxID=460621 RepID=UPI002541D124|nr:taste receptor type 2 member 7-like [Euleptes europaea]
MAVMDRSMFSLLGIFFLIVFAIESIVSLLGNGFIIVMNGYSWLQRQKMLPCDFLLTTLSLSRFLWQWITTSSRFVYVGSPETYIHSKKEQAFTFCWIYLNMISLWCATWLNVFYCVKVTNFAHPLFAWLKLRIGVLVPRCLGISLLAFITCSIYPVVRALEDEKCRTLTGNLPENTSQSEAHDHYPCKFLISLQFYFTVISFSICLTASTVLLLSLWRHTRNLRKSGLSSKDLSTQAHLSVMKPLLLLLIFYILHFAAMILGLSGVFKYGKLERLISDIFLSSYPSAHAVILIFTNPKLRKVCTHVLNLRRSTS